MVYSNLKFKQSLEARNHSDHLCRQLTLHLGKSFRQCLNFAFAVFVPLLQLLVLPVDNLEQLVVDVPHVVACGPEELPRLLLFAPQEVLYVVPFLEFCQCENVASYFEERHVG
jgi:hypothetical protein